MNAESLRRTAERHEQSSRLTVMSRITPEGCGLMAKVFHHAAALAAEAEVEAGRASDLALTHVEPKYPPLVALLIDAARMSDEQAAKYSERAEIRAGKGQQ